MDLKKYTALKDKVDGLQRRADKVAGALDQLQAQLKKEFGCDTIAEAEKLLAKLDKDQARAEKELEAELAAFQKKWGALLEND